MSTSAAIKKKADFVVTTVEKYVAKGDSRQANTSVKKLEGHIKDLEKLGTEEAKAHQAEYESFIEKITVEINAAAFKAKVAEVRKSYEAQQKWIEKELEGKGVRSKCEGYMAKIEKALSDNDEMLRGGGEEGTALLAEITEYLEDVRGRLDSVALAGEVKAILEKAEFQLKWTNTYLDQDKEKQANAAYDKLKDIVTPFVDGDKYSKVDTVADFMARYSELQARMGDEQAAKEAAAGEAVSATAGQENAKVTKIKKDSSVMMSNLKKAVDGARESSVKNFTDQLKQKCSDLEAMGSSENGAAELKEELERFLSEQLREFGGKIAGARVEKLTKAIEQQRKYLDSALTRGNAKSGIGYRDAIVNLLDGERDMLQGTIEFQELHESTTAYLETVAPELATEETVSDPAPAPKSTPVTAPAKATSTPSKPAASAKTKTADYRKNDTQLKNAKGAVNRMFTQAETYLKRGETGKAMQIMQNARKSLEELKENHQECTPGKLEEVVSEVEKKLAKFNDSFYGEQRISESRPLISDMSFGTSGFEHNLKQGKYDEALVCAERFKKGVVAMHEHELELLKDANIKSQYNSHFHHYVKMLENLEETLEEEKRSRHGDQGTGLAKIMETIKTDSRFSVAEYMPRDEDAEEINQHVQEVKLDWRRLADTLLTDNLKLKKVVMAPTDNPSFMQTSKAFNQIGGFIENDLSKIRAQCEKLSATDFMTIKEVHMEVKGVSEVHQMNIDQVENNIVRPLNSHKNDETARKMWLPAKVFVAQWKQVTAPMMRAIDDIINAIAFCKYSIGSLDSIMVECEKRILKDSLPTTRSVNFTTSDGWTGPDFGQLVLHDEGEKYEYKDHEIAEYVVLKCDRIIDSLTTDAIEHLPSADQLKDQVAAIKSRAIKWHALNALRGLCTAGCENRATYWQALRRYPIARSVGSHRLLTYKMKHYERRIYDLPHDVEFSENATDPFTGQTVDDAHDSERIEWYQKPLRIVPNSLDEDDSAPVCGEICFGKNYINEGDPNFAKKCTGKFAMGDDIHARAFWPRLIKDFAVARDRETGKLIKGPKDVDGQFNVELLLFVYLDDVALERKGQPLKSFSWYSDGSDGTSSIYSAMKSVDFVVQRNEKFEYNGSVHSDWDLVAQRISLELLRRNINSGDHKLRFEICYRIVAASLFPPEPTFYDFDTPVSLPISKGEMTLTVNRKPTLHDILPKNFRNEAEVSRMQSIIKSDLESSVGAVGKKQQAVITAAIKSDLYPVWEKEVEEHETVTEVHGRGGTYLGKEKKKSYKMIDVCYKWGMGFQSAVYLSPAVGWNRESVKFFSNTAFTMNPNEKTKIAPNKPTIPPVTAITSSEQIEFEADLLPSNILPEAKIDRFDGDEDAKSGLASVEWTHVDLFNTISEFE